MSGTSNGDSNRLAQEIRDDLVALLRLAAVGNYKPGGDRVDDVDVAMAAYALEMPESHLVPLLLTVTQILAGAIKLGLITTDNWSELLDESTSQRSG